ncbi:Probable N-acetylglucosaminyl-phosphatidylinositol de-N-acetylase [Linum perenne]
MAGLLGFGSLAPKTKNVVVAGGLSAFVFGVYFYTMRAVGGSDELQVLFPDNKPSHFKRPQCLLIVLFDSSFGYILHTGNADGMGNTRKDELYQACLVLKVPVQQVKILDHPDLQIITFDDYGVSGHCNHCDVHNGVRKLLQNTSERHLEAWELVSNNILRKYSGPVDVWLSMLLATKSNNREAAYCLLNDQPWKSFHAMAAHSSQWVWFRKLFVLFSSYTYVNTIQRIN